MDPNEALRRCRQSLARWLTACDHAEDFSELVTEKQLRELSDLADHFEALDGWMSNGGFLPRAWMARR